MSEATQDDIVAAALAAAARVHIVTGSPDDLEVAALVAGLAAVVGAHEPDESTRETPRTDQWTNRARSLRAGSFAPDSDQWVWSLR